MIPTTFKSLYLKLHSFTTFTIIFCHLKGNYKVKQKVFYTYNQKKKFIFERKLHIELSSRNVKISLTVFAKIQTKQKTGHNSPVCSWAQGQLNLYCGLYSFEKQQNKIEK